MAVRRQRIVGGLEVGLAHRQGGGVVLSQQIVAVVAVRITGTGSGGIAAPADGTGSIEQAATADGAGGHLLQVVGGCQVVARQLLGLQGTAIAIDLHLAQVGEAGAADEGIGQLIDTRGGHTDLCPATCGQHGMGGIAAGGGRRDQGTCPGGGTARDRQFEADQLLVATVAEDDGHESHIERATAARHTDILLYLGHGGQRHTGYPVQALHVALAHVDKFGIVDGDGVNGVGIAGTQFLGIGEERQQGVNPDLLGGQVEELLRLCSQARQQENHTKKESADSFHR